MENRQSYKNELLQKCVTASSLKAIVEKKFETLKDSDDLDKYDLESIYYDIDYIFSNLYKYNQGGYVTINTWCHVNTNTIDNTWMTYGISRNQLIESAEQYLYDKNKWAQNENSDWVFVDLLMFAEYVGIISEIYRYRFNTTEYHNLYKRNKVIPDNIKIKEQFSGWLWLLVFISFIFIYLPVTIIIFTVFLIKKIINFVIVKKLIESSIDTEIAYNSILTRDWKVVWDDLNHSRRKGVIWDDQVFEIVRKNL